MVNMGINKEDFKRYIDRLCEIGEPGYMLSVEELKIAMKKTNKNKIGLENEIAK